MRSTRLGRETEEGGAHSALLLDLVRPEDLHLHHRSTRKLRLGALFSEHVPGEPVAQSICGRVRKRS